MLITSVVQSSMRSNRSSLSIKKKDNVHCLARQKSPFIKHKLPLSIYLMTELLK
ncbi:hypothetical protein Mapa_002370 [Marchantia paleacea]|nr:hypothetical protein Mapa_002370 [Marchantia paleacea]